MKKAIEMTRSELEKEVTKLRKQVAREKRWYKVMQKDMLDWVLSIKDQQKSDKYHKELMNFFGCD